MERAGREAEELKQLASDIAASVLEDVKVFTTQYSALAERLAQKDALLEEHQRVICNVEQRLEEAEVVKAKAASAEAFEVKIAHMEQLHRELEATAAAFKRDADQNAAKLAHVLRELERSKAEQAQNKRRQDEEDKLFDIIEIEPEVEVDQAQPELVDFDEWNIRSAGDTSKGIARLRHMLLDYRAPPASSLLETDEIRSLLQIVRRVCVDKALTDSSMEPSSAQWLQFPEFLYAWFGNRPALGTRHQTSELRSRAAADGDCARFLHRLGRLHNKHRELATFRTLLNSCEVDEVSYYMHARRVLLGVNHSSQLNIEVDRATAIKACKVLIMRHAEDAHADTVRADMTKSLLSSISTSTTTGAMDSAALLTGLLSVYKEEKQQLRTMLEVLHKAGTNLRDYPAIHKVRAMLHSVDPTASDYEVLDIYQRCNIVDNSQLPSGDPESLRIVPFGMLWIVLQRHGFMVKRQRIGMQYQPDVLQESPALAQCTADALASWLTVKPYVRTLVNKAQASEYECERLWSRHAKYLIKGIDAASQTKKGITGAAVLFRLKRLLTSAFMAQSLRYEIIFPPHNLSSTVEELTLMATVIKQRDLLADAAQIGTQNSITNTRLPPALSAANAKQQDVAASRLQVRAATPSFNFSLPRPQSAMQ